MNSRELRQQAWSKLSGNWGGPIAVTIVYGLIIGLINGLSEFVPFLGLASLIVTGPLMVGISGYFINFAKSRNPDFEQLFDGFKYSFGNSIVLNILTGLFVFLWALLFIIPGIVKAYAYSMGPYLMAENPSITATEALDESQRLMDGHKMDLFILQLSFFGWFLLGIITFGIALIWVVPYMQAATAEFYVEISGGNVVAEVDEEKMVDERNPDSFDAFLK